MKRLFKNFDDHPKIDMKNPENCDAKIPASNHEL